MDDSQRFALENSPQIAKIIAIHQNCRRYCRMAILYPIWTEGIHCIECIVFFADHSHEVYIGRGGRAKLLVVVMIFCSF